MAIKIGEKPAESLLNNPLGLLYSCHRRVEHFFNVMVTVTQAAQGGTLSEGQRHALKSALRYFREAAPLHTLDEEESLFPRMLKFQNPKIKTMLDKLEGLKHGHREAEDNHQKIDQWIQEWLNKGTLSEEKVPRLSEYLNRLSDFYQAHILMEETDVFPLAETLLDQSEIGAIGQEMVIRRGLDPDALKQLTEDLKKPSRPV